MPSTTVRAHQKTHAKLRRLSAESGRPIPDVLDEAVELLERERLLDATNAAFAALRDDATAWKAEQDERQLWETTLADDLKD
jgi:hypothetical protein